MVLDSEVKDLLAKFPKFDDTLLSLQYAPRLPKAMVKETKKIIALARKFNQEVTIPYALELDRKTHEDHDFLPWDLIKKANEYGWYSMWIPKVFGGRGMNIPSCSYALEEIGSACLGIGNVVGVHYLGVMGIICAGNAKLSNMIFHEVAKGEKTGNPCTLSLCITEPNAGTDTEELELINKGKASCYAEKVKGGYVVNGRKIFISMGHVAQWTVLYAYSNLKKPGSNIVGMLVKTGTKGLSFGRHENKMGQRICPASELIFEDCFVPDEHVIIDKEMIKKFTNKPPEEIFMKVIDYIVSISRCAVGAWGVGAARGAFEKALKYAAETKVDGKLLINHEWAQCLLSEMYKNIALGRLSYIEGNYANSHRGIFEILQFKPLYYYLKYMPTVFFDTFVAPFLKFDAANWLMSKYFLDMQPHADQLCTSGWASLAKFACTDFGTKNALLALELMGHTGLRQDRFVEKQLRDAKLLQIYEGTNQLNRVNLFKCLIAPVYPQASVFEE
jgi:alkylation response protein AidB-like acyl-CoA dehydrogenase